MPDEKFTPGPSGLSPDQIDRLADAIFRPVPPSDPRAVKDRLIEAMMKPIPERDLGNLNPLRQGLMNVMTQPPPAPQQFAGRDEPARAGLTGALAGPAVPANPQAAARNGTPLFGLGRRVPPRTPPVPQGFGQEFFGPQPPPQGVGPAAARAFPGLLVLGTGAGRPGAGEFLSTLEDPGFRGVAQTLEGRPLSPAERLTSRENLIQLAQKGSGKNPPPTDAPPSAGAAGADKSAQGSAEAFEDAEADDRDEEETARAAQAFLEQIDGVVTDRDRLQADRLATVVGDKLIESPSERVPDAVLRDAATLAGFDPDKILLMREIVEGGGDKAAIEARIAALADEGRIGFVERSDYLAALQEGKDAEARGDVLSFNTRRALATPTKRAIEEGNALSALEILFKVRKGRGLGAGQRRQPLQGEAAPKPGGTAAPKPEPQRRKGLPPEGQRFHAPPRSADEITGVQGLTSVPGRTPMRGTNKTRRRWKDKKGRIYEWDSKSGALEQYDKRGRHLGEVDPISGNQLKGPVKGRRIKP